MEMVVFQGFLQLVVVVVMGFVHLFEYQHHDFYLMEVLQIKLNQYLVNVFRHELDLK